MDMNLAVRGVKYELGQEMQSHIQRRLESALGRFKNRIGRVEVLVSDINGPKGGVDKRCKIAVELIPRGVVRVEGLGHDPASLISNAAKRVGQAVQRTLGRLRRRRSSPHAVA